MSDEAMPNPQVWPECAVCETTWIMRRAISLTKGYIWVWQRDCKHKTPDPILVNADGPIEPAAA